MNVFLTTERLLLRQFTEDDADHLLALDSDPEVMRYIGPYALPDRDAYRGRIRTRYLPYYEKGGHLGLWAVVERSSGDFLGWICLRPALDYPFAAEAGFSAGELELGYRLRRSAWGKGYATEGARALVRRAFDHPATTAVVSCALIGNVASWRVMEKAGLKRVGQFVIPGYEQPAVKYTLSREEWQRGRGRSN